MMTPMEPSPNTVKPKRPSTPTATQEESLRVMNCTIIVLDIMTLLLVGLFQVTRDFNFYRYVGNSPVNYFDPFGLMTKSEAESQAQTYQQAGFTDMVSVKDPATGGYIVVNSETAAQISSKGATAEMTMTSGVNGPKAQAVIDTAEMASMVVGGAGLARAGKELLKQGSEYASKAYETIKKKLFGKKNQTDKEKSDGTETANEGGGNGGNDGVPEEPPPPPKSKKPKTSVTEPTGEKGGTPSGKRTEVSSGASSQNQRDLVKENESADILADKGYKVEQNPEVPGDKNPDYKIEGEVFDCYAPNTDNLRTIRKKISKKVGTGQASRIVINLDDTSLNASDVTNLLKRQPKEGLNEVIGIKDGQVIQIFP